VIGSNSIARTATCSRVFCLRSPMSAMTNTEAIAPVGRAIRSRSFARCAPLGLKTVRYRCVSRATTGRREETRRTTRHSSPNSSRTPARTLSIAPRVRFSKAERPVYGRMFQTPFSDQIRNEAHVDTIAVGAISEADHVNSIVAAGRADLCAIARPHLADPAWTLHEAAKIGVADIAWPKQYFSAKAQYEANLARAAAAQAAAT